MIRFLVRLTISDGRAPEALVHRTDHAADMTDGLVRCPGIDLAGNDAIFPGIGVCHRIGAGQCMQRLVAALLDQQFDRALPGIGPFTLLVRRHLRKLCPLRRLIFGIERRRPDLRFLDAAEDGFAQGRVLHRSGSGTSGDQRLDPGEHVDDRLLRPNGRLLIVEVKGAGAFDGVRIGLNSLRRLGLGQAAPVGLVGLVHAGYYAAGLGAGAIIGDLDLG